MSFWSGLGYALGALGQVLPGSPAWREVSQQANRLAPNMTRDPAMLAALVRRGHVQMDQYYDELSRQGFDRLRADQMLHITDQLLQGNDLVRLHMRGEISDNEFYSRGDSIGWDRTSLQRLEQSAKLRLDPDVVITAWRRGLFEEGGDGDLFKDLSGQGYSKERIETLKKVYEFFPNPNDLVRFAVREVYSPEIRERFQLDEDLPPEFISEAHKAGLPEDQAKNYWASHWELPSIQMGFEMLHRRIIGNEDLKLLMRSLDVMPFWRDKLIELSYSPLTRVDVRRMHKIGVLDRDGVKDAYLDIGYSDERAEQLTEFTLLYNEDPPEDEKTEEEKEQAELKGITKSNIVSAYKDRYIERSTAEEYLQGIGLSETVADFLLGEVDFELKREEVKDEIANIGDEYIAGGVEHNEAVAQLTALDLKDKQIQNLMEGWERKKRKKDKRPSRADLDKFVAAQIITIDQYREELETMGYSDKYISWFTQFIGQVK